jgi:hypothetical protein
MAHQGRQARAERSAATALPMMITPNTMAQSDDIFNSFASRRNGTGFLPNSRSFSSVHPGRGNLHGYGQGRSQ